MAKARFEYRGHERTSEEVEQRSRRSYGYDGVIIDGMPEWRPKEGENIIRILPVSGGRHWELDIYQHYNIGVDGGSYLCLEKMLNEPCPICEARLNAADEDESKDLKPSHRRLCWLIDRKNEKAGPQLYNIPDSLFTDINARAIDRKTGQPILIDDPEEGFDVIFTRVGTTKNNTDYKGVDLERDPTPIHDDQRKQDAWLDYVAGHPLKEMLEFKEIDYLEKILRGQISKRQDAATGADREVRVSGSGSGSSGSPRTAEGDSRSRRTSRRAIEPEGEPEPERTSRRGEPVEEPEPEPRGSRRPARREEPEPEPEQDPEPETRATNTRRPARRTEEPTEPARRGGSVARRRPGGEADPPQSRTARAGLARLRPTADPDDEIPF